MEDVLRAHKYLPYVRRTLAIPPTKLEDSSDNSEFEQVICVPHIHKILISAQILASDMNVSVEFNKYDFLAKDQECKEILFFGISNNGLYHFTPDLYHQCYNAEVFEDLLHRRFGHPSIQTFKDFSSYFSS